MLAGKPLFISNTIYLLTCVNKSFKYDYSRDWRSNGVFFYPLEVVGRASEAQLQVGENLNKIN